MTYNEVSQYVDELKVQANQATSGSFSPRAYVEVVNATLALRTKLKGQRQTQTVEAIIAASSRIYALASRLSI